MILCPRPLPPGTWPKASDEADGNAGRPQAWFFPDHRGLVFSGSQAKNISYSTDHRWKIFRTLPITGKTYFGFSGSQAKTISYSTEHRQKLFRTLPITGKTYFVL